MDEESLRIEIDIVRSAGGKKSDVKPFLLLPIVKYLGIERRRQGK